MAYKDVIDLILPPTDGRSGHITGHYGEMRAKGPHGGSDFNYVGGQAGINLKHPPVHSPVSGEVVFVGGQYGTVTIRDAEGNEHKLLHMQTQTVQSRQMVEAGDQIGTMGGRGPKGANHYAQHVHYQMKDCRGRAVNPEDFWKHRSISEGLVPATRQSESIEARGVVRQGDQNTHVRELQQTLATLGYRNPDGTPLGVDGDFGANTRAAVEAFQREHGLKVDGVVGNATQRVLAATQANPFEDKSHPQHALYTQALRGVHAEEDHRRVPHGRHSENLAGALTAAAANAGLARIDRVELNVDGSRARAVQVHPLRDEPGLNRVTMAIETHVVVQAPKQAHAHQDSAARDRHAVQAAQQQVAAPQPAPQQAASSHADEALAAPAPRHHARAVR